VSWAQELEASVGSRIRAQSALAGGDINDAYAVDLADGRQLFVKTRAHAPTTMYAREASGLRWLAQARALRVPEVIAQGESFLALERIASAQRSASYEEALGRGLAALHRAGAPCFGLHEDNFVGSLRQSNEPCDDWLSFYRERRLRAQLALADKKGRAERLRAKMERLIERLPMLVGDPEPPARLHGDLWGGNVICDERGAPVLIDPAVYGGSREIDLAMLQLFGGFSPRALAAYDEVFPLAAGFRERVTLYQIYPLMVHVNLFGGGYVSGAEHAIESYL